MPYDALGNYIPGDDEEVARMRAELAQKKEPSLLDRTVQNLEAFYKMLPMRDQNHYQGQYLHREAFSRDFVAYVYSQNDFDH